jgi:ATP-binding cassette, subfamily B, bacterial
MASRESSNKVPSPRLHSTTEMALATWRGFGRIEKFSLVFAFMAMFAAAFLASIVPVIVGNLVNSVIAKPHELQSTLFSGLALVTGALLGTQVLQVARRQLVESVATSYERDLRSKAYTHILMQDLSFIKQGQVGGVYGRVNRGIEGSTKLVKILFMDFFPTVALAISALGIAFSKNWELAIVMSLVIPTGLLLVRWQIRSQAGIRVNVRDHKERIDSQVVELLPALESVRAYGAEGYFGQKVRDTARDLQRSEMKHHKAMAWFDFAKFSNETFWYVVVLVVAIEISVHRGSGAGIVLTYALLFNNITQPLRDLHRMLDETSESGQQARDLAIALASPIDESYEVRSANDVPSAREPISLNGNISSSLQAALEVRNVSYDYANADGEDVPVLQNLSLVVPSGQRIGLAGPSGCGKSTLLKIIERLQFGATGDILLFGKPLNLWDREALASTVGYVSQRYFLYRGTVRENIIFGAEGKFTNDDVEGAARRANIHDVIMSFPQGYETLIHERGDSLSGGQAQRVCLARALLRNPSLLLLDEPTSALDNESQRVVQRAIDELEGVTIIEVAHRLDTLRSADLIYVLDHGAVAQQGTYDELANGDGLFARLLYAPED